MAPTLRTGPSIPARKIYEHYPPTKPPQRVLDFGCGYGHDVRFFNEMGYEAVGYDPKTYPELPTGTFDIVAATYVFGTIDEGWLRARAVKHMESFGHAGTIFVISHRTWEDIGYRRNKEWQKWKDGWLTERLQFHRGYDFEEAVHELRHDLSNIQFLYSGGGLLMLTGRLAAWRSSSPDTAEQTALTFDT